MGHLTLEALARLLDEQPTGEELKHLNSCLHCTAELAAMRDQVESLGNLPDVRPPQEDWDVLEARLLSEGVIQKRGWTPLKSLAVTPGWMQAAAGMVLFLGGMGLGAAVVRQNAAQDAELTSLSDLMPVTSSLTPANLGQAEDAVRMAERQYMDALMQYRTMRTASDDGYEPQDPAGRFAALDALVATSQAAVRQSPADPFLNGILISAMAERQAALQRVSGSGEWY
jgi:hypothetical protein